MILYINLIKFLAVGLILNSHYDIFYPIKAFATGGAIGNSLFFAVSGYCLYNLRDEFAIWYKKRLMRIYPQVIIVTLIGISIGFYNIATLIGFIQKILYPTEYWFISAIVIFYIGYYFIVKSNMRYKNSIIKAIILLIIPYIMCYVLMLDTTQWIIEDHRYFKWIFYFQTMLLGAYFKQIEFKMQRKKTDLFKLIVIIISYFCFKYLMSRDVVFMRLQLVTHILTMPMIYYIFKILSFYEKNIQKYKETMIIKFINLVSNLTLEIYLIQFMVIMKLKEVIFPINIMIGTFIIIVFAYLVQHISSKSVYILNRNIKKI